MSNDFLLISQSLRKDRGRFAITILCGACALLAAWIFWAFRTNVSLYETSKSARMEVSASAYPVQTERSGRLTMSDLTVGAPVKRGQLLAELDFTEDRLQLAKAQALLANLDAQALALEARAETDRSAGADEKNMHRLSSAAMEAQIRQAVAEAEQAEHEGSRARQLRDAKVLAAADAEKAQTAAAVKRSAADALLAEAARLEPETKLKQSERSLRLAQINEDRTRIDAQRVSARSDIAAIQERIERARVYAPVDGRVAEVAPVVTGTEVAAAQTLGVILPESDVHIVAEFDPADAFGKIRRGQSADLKLAGFAWAQYGLVRARVTNVADEIANGTVRVELAVTSAPPKLPVRHGVPGTVEIPVGNCSPMALLLRSVTDFNK